ncbi:MAG TPA: hypothetical protein VFU05_06670, partial [Cyclobacteriaceae bacterium]|nr:hypothetical protein [Cyclobacteriaceae bacterium]
MKKFGWLCLLLTLPYLIKAQVSSIGSGDWNTPGNWSCTCIPGPGNGTVTISPFDIITLSSGAQQVDALVVDSDATLNLNGGTMVVTGSIDVVVGDGFSTFDGFLNIGSGGSLEGRSTFTSSAGNTQIDGFYIHNQNGGAIPDASWNSGSTLEVRGVTTTAPTNFGQSFYNLRWNSTHTAAISLGAQLTTILNDLTIVSTGSTRALNLSTNTNGTLNITGDLFIQGSSLFGVVGTGSYTLNIGQNLEISSTLTNSFLLTGSGSPVVNVTGNFIKSGTGTVNFASSTLAAGASALNISGNFTMSAGTLTETGIGNGTVNFVGSGTHIFSKTGGSISNTVNFTNASTSTLDLGTSILEGGGAFTNNGTIQLGSVHASGALQNTATLDADCGNIITPFATRTFAANSTIIYNGSAIQAIGDGFPSSGGDVNLTINNSNNVNLSDNLEIVALRTLTLTSGNIVIGNKTLTINGTISGSGGIVGGATSNMVIGGTGNFGTLTFAGTNQLLNFTINRTSSGLVTLGGNLTILGTFTQTAGDIALNGFNLSIQGNFARTAGNITVNSASTLAFEGAGTLPTSVGLSGTTLSTLTLDRSGATLTSGASITVTNLNLLDGTFANGAGFAIASGGTITRNAGVINTSPTSTGTYNIFYNVSGTISSGNELPAVTTRIQNVTIDGGGDVNLSASRTINGNLTLTSGDFNIGSNTVTLEGNLVANTSSTFTSGTFIFDGNTTISGSAVPTFGNIILTDT